MSALFFGKKIIHLDAVDSTNDYLQKLISKTTVSEGTVVVADEQFSGKGQRGNTWLSEAGKNLTFSVFLQPKFLPLANHFMLNKVIALGIFDLLKKNLKADVKIKWPNDIYVNEKKNGGILIENSIGGNAIQNSIIGIGLNVNQTKFEELSSATSLKNSTGKKFDLDELLSSLCSSLEKRYLQLRSVQTEKINSDYLSSLYRRNKKSRFIFKGEEILAEITSVSHSGKLILEKDSKEKIEADFKEIVFL